MTIAHVCSSSTFVYKNVWKDSSIILAKPKFGIAVNASYVSKNIFKF